MLLMNNLKLVTTENFGGKGDNSQRIAPCDFWIDENGEPQGNFRHTETY